MVKQRATGMVLIAVLMSVVLSGCDMNIRTPAAMSIQLSERGVNVASCEAGVMPVATVLFDPEASNKTAPIAIAIVDPQIELKTGESFDLATLSFDRPVAFELGPGDEIFLALYARIDRTGGRIEGSYEVPTSGLADDLWLHEDGSVTESPCAG